MGDISHGLCRCQWQSTASSGAMRMLATLWLTLGTLGLFFLPGEGEFCGDVHHRFCRRQSLSVAQLGTTCVHAILWATPGTRNSLKLVLYRGSPSAYPTIGPITEPNLVPTYLTTYIYTSTVREYVCPFM